MGMGMAWAAEAVSTTEGSGYWQLALVLMGIGLLGLFARWRRVKTPRTPTAKEIRERDKEPNRYREPADRAIVELLELSRSLNAQVDTKIRLLNRLVKDAEEKSAELKRLLDAAGVAVGREGENGCGEVVESDTGISGNRPPGFVSELQERIWNLHQQGKTAAEIARATNLSTTEVRFALQSLSKYDINKPS